MKKICSVFLMLMMICGVVGVSAANGDVIGQIYSTDILAYINGKPVPSYNIGGRTVIIAEDLEDSSYGFAFGYNDAERLLTLDMYCTMPWPTEGEEIRRGIPGQVLGQVYETDIRFLLNGMEIKGYNIGGRTAFCIEDIGEISGSPYEEYGYSPYLCNYVWDETNRTIELRTFVGNVFELAKETPGFTYSLSGDQLKVDYGSLMSPWSPALEVKSTQNELTPVYLTVGDGTAADKMPVGLCYQEHVYIADMEAVKAVVNDARPELMSHDAAVQYLTGLAGYKEDRRMENGEYTVLLLRKQGAVHPTLYAVSKNGGYAFLQDFSEYGAEYTVTIGSLEGNKFQITLYPFAGPHGATTLVTEFDLEQCLYL